MWILKKRYEDLKETEKISSAFKTTINNLEDENKNLKIAIKERDKMLEQELKKRKELENKIIDLNNNIEFLTNNLSPAKQKKKKRVSEQIQDNSDTK